MKIKWDIQRIFFLNKSLNLKFVTKENSYGEIFIIEYEPVRVCLIYGLHTD